MSPAIFPYYTTAPCGRIRRSTLATLFLVVFLAAGLSEPVLAAPTSPSTPATFVEHEIVLGDAERQTILTGFFFDGGFADLAVAHIDEHDNRQLRIFSYEGTTWKPRFDATLGAAVSFVDVIEMGGRDRLITYEHGRVNRFDPDSATEGVLAEVTTNFNPPRNDEVPHVDITKDVNADGRDDLVVPDVDGFWVILQMSNGAFAEPVKIGPATDMSRIYGADGYRFDPWSQSRIHRIDYNQDGRDDLVHWSEDHFEVHLQDARGLFDEAAQSFTTEVPFDTDNRDSLSAGDMTGRVLHALTDLSDDGIADLVVYSLDGTRISNKRSSFEVHLGAQTPEGGIAFAPAAANVFESDSAIQLDMDVQDFDGDGHVDLMFTTIETRFLKRTLWKEIKGAMGDDVLLELEFYRMNGGRYSERPDATRRIALDGAPSYREPGWVPLNLVLDGATHENRPVPDRWPRAFNPTLLIGDVTGDERADLLIEHTFRALDLYAGTSESELFADRSESVKLTVPNDEEYVWLVDLNKDGKMDVLLHDPFTLRDIHGAPMAQPGSEPHRVTILIAR